jgi:hypothetical protein
VGPRSGLGDFEKRKFLTCRDSNSDPSVVQPVASRYPVSGHVVLNHNYGNCIINSPLILEYKEIQDMFQNLDYWFRVKRKEISSWEVVAAAIWERIRVSCYNQGPVISHTHR